ncbi:MAG: cyclase family protein [Bacteroidota bacterium]
MKTSWEYLSYSLNESMSGYGNGDRIQISRIRNQAEGHSSNNTAISLPSHFGTHIDYPLHFDLNGKSGNDYEADFFIFDHPKVIELEPISSDNHLLISPDYLGNFDYSDLTDILIIKTGYCYKRSDNEYWQNNPGFAPETAAFLKEKLPNLRAIGFDSISLSSYQHREIGRIAHREFLSVNDILIIEDMDLTFIDSNTIFKQIIVSPFRFDLADGAPVTVLANILHEV